MNIFHQGAVINLDDESSEIIIVNDDPETPQMEPTFSGPGGRRRRGSGDSVANPNNSYSGPTNIEEGTLEVPQGGLGGSTIINLSEDTTIRFNNHPEKVIVSEDTVLNILGNTATISVINGVTDYLGTINDNGNSSSRLIIKTEEGNNGGIRFSSDSPAFSGTTIVQQNAELRLDTLSDNVNTVAHNGNIEVYGALKGNATINGNVTVRDGGYLLLGAEVGTQTHITGDLILESGSHVFLSLLEDSNDSLLVDGNIIIENNVELILTPFEDTIMSDAYTLVTYGGSLTGQFTTITNFRDNDPDNGVDTLNDDQYPDNINYGSGTNSTITGTR